MSCIFTPRYFAGPSFSCPAFSAPPFCDCVLKAAYRNSQCKNRLYACHSYPQNFAYTRNKYHKTAILRIALLVRMILLISIQTTIFRENSLEKQRFEPDNIQAGCDNNHLCCLGCNMLLKWWILQTVKEKLVAFEMRRVRETCLRGTERTNQRTCNGGDVRKRN